MASTPRLVAAIVLVLAILFAVYWFIEMRLSPTALLAIGKVTSHFVFISGALALTFTALCVPRSTRLYAMTASAIGTLGGALYGLLSLVGGAPVPVAPFLFLMGFVLFGFFAGLAALLVGIFVWFIKARPAHKVTSIAVVALVVLLLPAVPVFVEWLHTPTHKTKPIYQMQISGLNEPAFDISISVKYVSTNSKCSKGWPMTEHSRRVTAVPLNVERVGTRYLATGPIDVYSSGYCDWTPFSVDYEIRRGDAKQFGPVPPTPIVWFASDGRSSLQEFDIACHLIQHKEQAGYVCNGPLGKDRIIAPGSYNLRVNFVERDWRIKPAGNPKEK